MNMRDTKMRMLEQICFKVRPAENRVFPGPLRAPGQPPSQHSIPVEVL